MSCVVSASMVAASPLELNHVGSDDFPSLRSRWFHVGVMIFLLAFHASQVVQIFFYSPTGAVSEEMRGTLRLLFIPVHLVIVVLALPRLRALLTLLLSSPSLVALLALVLASIAWSVSPAVSGRRVVALLLTTLLGLHFATAFSTRQRLLILSTSLAALLVLSAVVAVAAPDLGQSAYGWRGVFTNKNTLGQFAALSILVFGCAAFADRRLKYLSVLLLPLAGTLLVLSDSMTSVTAALMVPLVFCFAASLRLAPYLAEAVFLCVLILAVLVAFGLVANSDAAFELLGRESTLTGRTDVWLSTMDMISARWWLGFGFGAFWASADAIYVWDAVGWKTPNAHNGVLELWLGLGLCGVLAFAVSFAATLARQLRGIRMLPAAAAYWGAGYLAIFLVFNISESLILEQNSLTWVLYVSLAVSASPGRGSRIQEEPLPEFKAGQTPKQGAVIRSPRPVLP